MILANKRNIFFIINPISGGKNKNKIPALIDKYLDKLIYNYNYMYTDFVGHAVQLAEKAVRKNYEIIVAVGGDGTVNEVATIAAKYNKTLGIIPLGSGNGLARFLKIPANPVKAIKLINHCNCIFMDVATLNKKYFFNMAGIGFDAQISNVFAKSKIRGLKGYLKLGIVEVVNYKSKRYQLEIDGLHLQRDAFAISIANSTQYGNNVYISPHSSVTDGLVEVCIIKPFPLFELPLLAYQMLRAKTHQSKVVEIISGKKVKIWRGEEGPVHVDGEPYIMGKEIEIGIFPAYLSVII